MIRFLAIMINLFSVLFVSALFDANVSVSMDAPVIVNAGEDFRVKITVNTDNLQSFARFQQNLPAGLKAKPENSANADFTFKDKRVRLIWLKLPQTNQITAVYNISVDERLKGTFSIGGKFSYIENNERKSADVIPQSITIIPSPNMDPSEIVDINEFEKSTIPELGIGTAESIACIRQTPYENSSGEMVVNVLVSKGDKEKFAKIEENIAPGFTAVNIAAKDGIFTYKEGEAKYLWMNLPLDRYFVVTYNLVPDPEKTIKDLYINGKFSYIQDEKTVVIDIIEKDVDLLSMSEAEMTQLIRQGKVGKQPIPADPITEPEKPTDKNQDAIKKPDPVNVKTPLTQKKTTNNYKNTGSKKYELQPQSGVYYRVQIAAGHRPVNIPSYFRKYNLSDVKKEFHEGWIKYSVGSFDIYKDARDYRVQLWNTTDIDDAFVSAYNNGKRITVQEALMIANQKWYK